MALAVLTSFAAWSIWWGCGQNSAIFELMLSTRLPGSFVLDFYNRQFPAFREIHSVESAGFSVHAAVMGKTTMKVPDL